MYDQRSSVHCNGGSDGVPVEVIKQSSVLILSSFSETVRNPLKAGSIKILVIAIELLVKVVHHH